MTTQNSKLRWGILGAAEIARKNWKAIQLTGNSAVTAVASRDPDRARQFIAQCQSEAPMENVPTAFDSYEELLASNSVDAVYIPLPTGVRKEWVLRAAQAGKHVLSEKPCAPTVADLEEMLEACRRNNVQFMDDVMFVHSQRFSKLREVLDDGQNIGKIRRIESAFSFPGSQDFFAGNIRMHSELEPLGCLGDLGWYCIRLALWAMNWEMPLEVTGRLLSEGRAQRSPAAVPTEFSGELIFKNGVSAGFYCSFKTALQQTATISGTNGYAQLSDFVLPFAGEEMSFELRRSEFRVKGCDFHMHTESKTIRIPESSHGRKDSQETNSFRNFANQVLSGKLNEAWPEAALKTQKVVCACLDSAGNKSRPLPLKRD
jgi:predicted dehydrogenase